MWHNGISICIIIACFYHKACVLLCIKLFIIIVKERFIRKPKDLTVSVKEDITLKCEVAGKAR